MEPRDRALAGATSLSAGQEQPSTGDLVRGIAEDAQNLVKQEVLLARQEITEGLVKAGKASALLIAGGVVGLYALGFVLTTLAWALEALGLPKWISFGLVALVLLIVTGVLALLGQKRLKASKVKPERAQAEFKETTSDLAAEAKVAAEGVKAELSATAQATKAEAQTAPDKAKAVAETVVEEVREAAEKAKQEIASRVKRDNQ